MLLISSTTINRLVLEHDVICTLSETSRTAKLLKNNEKTLSNFPLNLIK